MSKKSLVWSKALACLLIMSAHSFTLVAADSPPVALPEIKVVASDPAALEKVSSGAFTFSRSGPTNAAVTVNYNIGGSASNGVTYAQIPGSITIAPGALSADLLIQPLEDKGEDGNRTVTLTVATNASYKVAGHKDATVTIIDNDFNNLPPTVTITSPTNKTVFGAPANIVIAADAADVDNGVAKVSFYDGDSFLGSVTNTPYSLTWTNVPPGEHTLFARAVDTLGESTLSSAVRIYVTNSLATVVLTSPTNSAVFASPANVLLSADVSDKNGIAKVSFLANEKIVATVTNSPYSIVWSNVPPGRYVVTARATDVFGTSANSKSAEITVSKITVSNSIPVVTFVTPTNGTVFGIPANIAIAVTATDPDGIAKVSLYAGDHLLGDLTNAPYSLVWSNVPGGTYVLTARAVDNAGQLAYAQVKITVSNAPPQVTLTSPTNSAVFPAGANITVAADASDPDDAVAKVAFYVGDKLLGSVTNKPYSITWSNIPAGKYSLVARATDVNGALGASKSVSIVVTNGVVVPPVINPLPFVKIVSPTNGSVFGVSANIQVVAEATNANNSIKRVSFYANDRLLGTVTNQPYSLSWSNVAPGTYSLFARASDALDKYAYSTAIRIYVTNAAPTVTVTSPTNNASFAAPAHITLAAQAADADDSVIRVAFYYGGNHLIGYLTNAPYTLTWTNVPAGKYTVQAHATDAFGKDTWSESIHVTVTSTNGVKPAFADLASEDVQISSVERLGSGATEIAVEAPAATAVLLESTTNLTDWQAVATMLVRDGAATFTDAAAADGHPRFYRAKQAE